MKIKIINTTTNSYKTADQIAKLLVSRKLSPCVQIIPEIQSIYCWEGNLEKSREILLTIKTVTKKVQDCKELILKHHNYHIPELIVLDGEILADDYRDWFIKNS